MANWSKRAEKKADSIRNGQTVLATRTLASYHGSSFKALALRNSDRKIPLQIDAHGRMTRSDGKPLGEMFGLEIETGSRGIANNDTLADIMCNYVFPQSGFGDDFVRAESDCSLRGNSCGEYVTQVMTKSFIRNSYPNFKILWDKFFAGLGIMPNESCGMHVNISNPTFGKSEETRSVAVKKLLYVVNKHYKLFCIATNRSLEHNRYASPMVGFNDASRVKEYDLSNFYNDHGSCINMGHWDAGSDYGRVELRIVGPQVSFPCFRNTMEVVFHLLEAVKKLSWADLADPVKLFAGCNRYVFDRLRTNVYRAGYLSAEQIAAIRPTVNTDVQYI